jgi:hypothetical protein
MRTRNILTAIAFLVGSTAIAQTSTGEIQGKVFETRGVPAYSALVSVNNKGQIMKSIIYDDGSFTLKPLDAGRYTVKIINESDTFKRDVEVLANEITKIKDIVLSDSTSKLVEVEILADKLITPDQPNVIKMSGKQLKEMASIRDPKQLLAALTTDIKTDANGDAYVRGSRADDIIYFVDGVKQSQGRLVYPPKAALNSIMVYTGGLPAKYGDTTGGVVLIETKSYFTMYYEWLSKQ